MNLIQKIDKLAEAVLVHLMDDVDIYHAVIVCYRYYALWLWDGLSLDGRAVPLWIYPHYLFLGRSDHSGKRTPSARSLAETPP